MKSVTRCVWWVPLAAAPLLAQSPNSLFGVSPTPGNGSVSLTAPMQIIFLLTLLTILPAVIMSVTPFLRIITVLHFLRQALGTQTAPSNQVLVGIALFLSLLTIQPMANQIYDQAWTPMENGQMTVSQAAQEAAKPLRQLCVGAAIQQRLELRGSARVGIRPHPGLGESLGVGRLHVRQVLPHR